MLGSRIRGSVGNIIFFREFRFFCWRSVSFGFIVFSFYVIIVSRGRNLGFFFFYLVCDIVFIRI